MKKTNDRLKGEKKQTEKYNFLKNLLVRTHTLSERMIETNVIF
jgi:hypothetical protein